MKQTEPLPSWFRSQIILNQGITLPTITKAQDDAYNMKLPVTARSTDSVSPFGTLMVQSLILTDATGQQSF